ncbi:hypothetical protein CF319_g5290 [Tilletia indica]|nr:hypothetical protein CF319_g5290 [Tilletia indica]
MHPYRKWHETKEGPNFRALGGLPRLPRLRPPEVRRFSSAGGTSPSHGSVRTDCERKIPGSREARTEKSTSAYTVWRPRTEDSAARKSANFRRTSGPPPHRHPRLETTGSRRASSIDGV